ncbi:hypothetical protein BO71DRAFT_12105 [Aspergillus ellipticus CBS 707.79]|uniref:Zn(2)-C6 fungal-type domain-containing protein n=1 Tax=Aspergillus ellipticus CBS 707.79 TaxID=1448320 RepID=A0A319D6S6_9EURO|nr:hypothetical protein BO71DRAFT_12105 [Aspergillus ellipticus CBS 707.79]
MDPPTPHLLRRNGRLQSCEACRKLKSKCDHALPRCGRCTDKDIVCFYDPAPMTRKFRPVRSSADYPARSRRRETRRSANTGPPSSVSPSQLEAVDRALSHKQPVVVSTPPLESTGFLGPTSYRSLLRESDPAAAEHSLTAHTIESRQLDLGLQAVDFLVSEALLLGNLVKHIYNIGRAPIIPSVLMLPALDCLGEILDGYTAADEGSSLRTVVRIFENSYRPIPVTDDMKVEELARSISGKNLRWETIATVFTIASLGLLYLPPHYILQIDPQKRRKDDILPRVLEVTEQLSTLSNAMPVVNELSVCLKYYQMNLASQRFGDSSHRLYSALGELSSCIYATGIHHNDITLGQSPTFIYQWRRVCFSVVYAMDKTIATTLGRPPLMNRHYCVLEPPLDLEYDIDPRDYESNLRSINHTGWNRDGKCRPTTLFRLRFLLATVREEILELHLGVAGNDVVGRADGLLQKLRSIWDTCPDLLKYSPDMWDGSRPPNAIVGLLITYLDYLHSTFLLHRLTVQGMMVTKSQGLYAVAKTILSTVLVINEERERLRAFRDDFSNIFLPYGLPSAQLLSMELLHRSSSPSISATPGISRAEVIRELTLFVSCLSWAARPGSCNYGYCNQIKAKLTRTLDQILDPSFPAPVFSPGVDAGRPFPEGVPEAFDSGLSLNTLLDSGIESQWNFGLDLFSGSVF